MIVVAEASVGHIGRVGEGIFVEPEKLAVAGHELHDAEGCHDHGRQGTAAQHPLHVLDTSKARRSHHEQQGVVQIDHQRGQRFGGSQGDARPASELRRAGFHSRAAGRRRREAPARPRSRAARVRLAARAARIRPIEAAGRPSAAKRRRRGCIAARSMPMPPTRPARSGRAVLWRGARPSKMAPARSRRPGRHQPPGATVRRRPV